MMIYQCARCGRTHEGIEPTRFLEQPIKADGKTWDQWFTCPRTGDPVLLRMTGEKLTKKAYQS